VLGFAGGQSLCPWNAQVSWETVDRSFGAVGEEGPIMHVDWFWELLRQIWVQVCCPPDGYQQIT